MIFKPRNPAKPPHGRIDWVIYWGASISVASYAFYFVDLSTGDVGYLPAALLPAAPPSGPAGGDLAGTYPNPSVATVPDSALSGNVPIMSAGVLPAVDGSLLTGVVAAPSGAAGGVLTGTYPNPAFATVNGFTTVLDGSGSYTLVVDPAVQTVVVSWGQPSFVGQLYAVNTGGGIWTIASSAGVADAGAAFSYMVL